MSLLGKLASVLTSHEVEGVIAEVTLHDRWLCSAATMKRANEEKAVVRRDCH